MDAQRRNASALRFRHSQSLASLRHRFNHANVRSTIQRADSGDRERSIRSIMNTCSGDHERLLASA
jgi:hypothetical protein